MVNQYPEQDRKRAEGALATTANVAGIAFTEQIGLLWLGKVPGAMVF